MSDLPRPDPGGGTLRFRMVFLLVLALGISVLFLMVVWPFLLAVLLAAVFAGLSHPLYKWLSRRLGGRRVLASVTTVALLVVGVGLPLTGFLTLVAGEAIQMSQGAEIWVQDHAEHLDGLRLVAERVPFVNQLLPDRGQVVVKLGEAAGRTASALMGALAVATRGTLSFFLQLFVLVYALFYFLLDGPDILRTVLHYIPLSREQKDELLERFVSVTRATLRGSLLIGLLQGGVAGVAFWAAGVPGPAFWGTVMVVLSIIPAVGAGLIWIPAVLYLFVVGNSIAGVGLLAWCVVVVSTLENFLRPRLIGQDARMSDLLILLSTLGGIVLFGAVGFIVGPIVAALFVTVWHIYGEVFHRWLPEGRVLAVTDGSAQAGE